MMIKKKMNDSDYFAICTLEVRYITSGVDNGGSKILMSGGPNLKAPKKYHNNNIEKLNDKLSTFSFIIFLQSTLQATKTELIHNIKL